MSLHPALRSQRKLGFLSFFDARSSCRLLLGWRQNLFATGTPVPGPTLPHHAITPFGHATHPPGTTKPRFSTFIPTVDRRPSAPQTAFNRQSANPFPTRIERFNRHQRRPYKPVFRGFFGSWLPLKDICPAFLLLFFITLTFLIFLFLTPFSLSSMRRRKRGKIWEDLGRNGERTGGGFCGPRVGYSRGFPWPGSRAARRFVRRGPT